MRLNIEKRIPLIVIISILVSPGLSVKTYLQKFNAAKSWNKNITIINGSCFSSPLNMIIVKAITKVIKINPIISDNAATAWLKAPKLYNANSSVNIKSWIA